MKRFAADRLILSVAFRKGHPAPPSHSLHLNSGSRVGTLRIQQCADRREVVVVHAHKRSACEGGQANSLMAAQYVRMSTEHQRYSTENQSEAIQRYAAQRG